MNPQGDSASFEILFSEGNRVFAHSSNSSCTQSLLFCSQGFYNAPLLYVTAELCYTLLLASGFASSTQGSQKNCTDTEGKGFWRPQSEANSCVNSILQIVQLRHRARKQAVQGQMLDVGRARCRTKNTSPPGLTLITGSPFITFRACWMPRTG